MKKSHKKAMSKTAAKKKKKKVPHQHEMKRTGMTLWCKCGLSTRIDCAHRWKLDRVDHISFEKMGGEIQQRREMKICAECGAIANINTTTGSCVITH